MQLFQNVRHLKLKIWENMSEVLKQNNMNECKTAYIHIKRNLKITRKCHKEGITYPQLIDSLMHLAILTSPDIVSAVRYLSQFNKH